MQQGGPAEQSQSKSKPSILDTTTKRIVALTGLVAAITALVIGLSGLWSTIEHDLPFLHHHKGPVSACPNTLSRGLIRPTLTANNTGSKVRFCPVDVNNGTPIGRSYTLSGFIIESLPPDLHMAVVSRPDPSTCDTNGNPGTGGYFLLSVIDPRRGGGAWQVTTPELYPGAQAIRRYIYFVVATQDQLNSFARDKQRYLRRYHSLKSYPGRAGINNLSVLAYITVQGIVPPGLVCKQG